MKREAAAGRGKAGNMASVIKKELYKLIDKEREAGVARWGLNHSNHESFAVVREEMDEVWENVQQLETWSARAWEATKKNKDGATIRAIYEEIYKRAVDTAVEAIQVAAMADKAIRSNVEIMAAEMRAENDAAAGALKAAT